MALAREGHHEIFAAPGNAGTARLAENLALDPTNPSVVSRIAQDLSVDLVVIGPEAPLVAGVADRLRRDRVAVFGPNKNAAQIEGSKSFAKEVMAAAGVPTATSVTVSTEEDLRRALNDIGAPYVVKADGLAAGKGVIVTEDLDQALEHARYYLQDGSVVVEEFLDGQEVSLFFVSDGKNVVALAPAQDYKRAFDSDRGPNTGGMGAYSPLPWLPTDFTETVTNLVALPTVGELAKRGAEFVGLLYCGLIVTEAGIKVIEFNARFGDPETQVVLARLSSPLAPLLLAAATGNLGPDTPVNFSEDVAVTVVLASEGYPENPQTGRIITGLEQAEAVEGVTISHAATSATEGGLIATGGRVLSVVAHGETFSVARERAYRATALIALEGSHYRTDIALRVSGE
jgi:phosphoribosylamine--glycine ligase